MVLLERIELSLPPYQRGVLPFNYKSNGTPPPTRTGTSLLLRESRLPIAPEGCKRLERAIGFEPTTFTLAR